MASTKLDLAPCDTAPTADVLRIDDPRAAALECTWVWLLHDGTRVGGHSFTGRGRVSRIVGDGPRTDVEAPPCFGERNARPSPDGTRVIAIEDKRRILELDLANGATSVLYTIERQHDLSDTLSAIDWLDRDTIVAKLGDAILLLARQPDGRLIERASETMASAFDVRGVCGRYVVGVAEKTLRFWGTDAQRLALLGSVSPPVKWARVGERRDGAVRTVVVVADGRASNVLGLEEAYAKAFSSDSNPKPTQRPKQKKGAGKPLSLKLERADTPSVAAPSHPPLPPQSRLVGVTAAGRAIAIQSLSDAREQAVVVDADGSVRELLDTPAPGAQLYVASIHPTDEKVLLGRAPVFPAPLVEVDAATGEARALGVAARRAGYVGTHHLAVLHHGDKRLTVHLREAPLGPPVLDRATEAAGMITDPACGCVILTAVGPLGASNTELHRWSGEALGHVANLAPSSARLKIAFVHETRSTPETLALRAGTDWYAIDLRPFS